MRNPARRVLCSKDVIFCGYSMPHPSEEKVNVRIQTRPGTTAEGAFRRGLADLADTADHMKATFLAALEAPSRTAGGVAAAAGAGAAASGGGGAGGMDEEEAAASAAAAAPAEGKRSSKGSKRK